MGVYELRVPKITPYRHSDRLLSDPHLHALSAGFRSRAIPLHGTLMALGAQDMNNLQPF